MAEYRQVIQKIVKKEKDVLGDRALEIARESGVNVDDEGNVSLLTEPGEEVLESLVDDYTEIGGNLAATLMAREVENMDLEGLELPDELEEQI